MSRSDDLFPDLALDVQACEAVTSRPQANAALHQWFTPAWAAEALAEHALSHLPAGSRILEPTCGNGSLLCAIPESLEAIGCEIDPDQAAIARRVSGRTVLVGDFLSIPKEAIGEISGVLGNPPFSAPFIHGMLDRCAELLPEGGQAGLLLPAYLLQASGSVERLSRNFSIAQQLVPRNVFPRLSLPLAFVTFTKEQRHRKLVGFLLYREAQEIRAVDKRWKAALSDGRDTRGAWYPVVREVLDLLGGCASLEEIYDAIQPKRPTCNPHWQAKVRQVVQHPKRFRRVGHGRYALRTEEL